jgi:hypothetical protein
MSCLGGVSGWRVLVACLGGVSGWRVRIACLDGVYSMFYNNTANAISITTADIFVLLVLLLV